MNLEASGVVAASSLCSEHYKALSPLASIQGAQDCIAKVYRIRAPYITIGRLRITVVV